jgi:hypothetical protein
MSEAPKPPAANAGEETALPDLELVRRAGFDLEHFLALPEFEQRMVLKMAERLVDAARRTEE